MQMNVNEVRCVLPQLSTQSLFAVCRYSRGAYGIDLCSPLSPLQAHMKTNTLVVMVETATNSVKIK